MSKHTPGPWVVAGPNLIDQADAGIWGSGEFDFVICDMQRDGYEDAEQKANALLISAAPDLLEALERLVSAARDVDHGYLDQAIDNAESAIAKARGQS